MRKRDLGAWAELLRVSALFTVPGDALAGAAALGVAPNRGTALALGSSLCLYEAGMALNDWADRDEDAIDRPHRPIPSGRIAPRSALAAAAVLTGAGLALSAAAGRRPLALATALAATVWSYDLHVKHTRGGPAAMAAARSLDVLLGAAATGRAATGTAATSGTAARAASGMGTAATGMARARSVVGAPARGSSVIGTAVRGAGATTVPTTRAALPGALVMGAHTYAVTSVSRHEAHGGSTLVPLTALAATLGLGALGIREQRTSPGTPAARLLVTALAGAYVRTAAKPFLHAALNPSPPLTQRAVGGGIRAMIPLQAALAARAGGGASALALMGLVPLARKLARKVSPT
ncbi:UbiA family prenyltransferase [Streptomyces sp. AM8-1-1]|uniref:UbiA family prenyltransferase n=1 Tax=Streptomyces sp. AM8-1-1 TaxID=3075825 RepID=UPI0028C3A8A7|nr:UbiA family prenyltransferase [Streptomyces sp. AM8-1-1]WNO71345.1 UbiA family prenyltransferase [Streptomyces sp. AM8-1-1]